MTLPINPLILLYRQREIYREMLKPKKGGYIDPEFKKASRQRLAEIEIELQAKFNEAQNALASMSALAEELGEHGIKPTIHLGSRAIETMRKRMK